MNWLTNFVLSEDPRSGRARKKDVPDNPLGEMPAAAAQMLFRARA